MKISFKSLCEADFSLLLKWLEAPHVKAWWDQDIEWTPDLIRENFDYIKGYKFYNGVAKAILLDTLKPKLNSFYEQYGAEVVCESRLFSHPTEVLAIRVS
ncbi:hypothetical protein [Legionella sp. W05-934-2]|uniref:hypothetical protein n=1 Tax=Legionella TaxID=445 RepID=UPI003462C491